MLSNSERDCLKGTVFFGALPDDTFDRITANAVVTSHPQGGTVCREGEEAMSVFCVAEGIVKLTVASRSGQDVVVDIFQTGDSFAEALAFRNVRYPVSAVAVVDSRVIAVPKDVIQTELNTHIEAMNAIFAATYSHLHRLVRQVEQLKAASGLQRVAGFILTLADKDANTSVIRMPYEKQTLASMLGIKPETLSRSFKRLSEHGIRVAGPVIEVQDRAALEAFLGES